MKRILYIITLMFFLSASLFAEVNIKESMNSKIHQALQILQSKKGDEKEKAKQIFKIFDNIFDYNLMAKLSLGKSEWYSINSEQKKRYRDDFVKLLKESFIEKLKLYNGQQIKIKDFKIIKRGRGVLKTIIIGKKDKTEVDYKFYLSKNRGWIIYDVIIADVSIIQSYRKQFADLLQNNSFEQFLKRLENSQTNNNA